MATAPRRPPAPGYGKAKGTRVLTSVVVIAFILAGVATIGFVWQALMRYESATQPTAVVDRLGQSQWLEIQERQLLRTGMLKLDQTAELIWDDIQVLQQEIDAYGKKYNELKVSDAGKRLIEDEWAVRYFADKWGERLPRDKVARHCEVRLNELLFTIREALGEATPPRKKAAYEISPGTKKELESIEHEVSRAKGDYTRHRRLLDALEASVAEGRAVMPGTLDDASQLLLQKIIEEEFRGRPLKREADSGQNGGEAKGGLSGVTAERESARLSPASLYDAGRIRPEEQDDSPGRLLGRDTINDRREPPRRQPGQ